MSQCNIDALSGIEQSSLLDLGGDIYVLQGVKMSTQNASDLEISGCTAYCSPRASHGSGIPTLVRQHLNATSRQMQWKPSSALYESIILHTTLDGFAFFVMNVYFLPIQTHSGYYPDELFSPSCSSR